MFNFLLFITFILNILFKIQVESIMNQGLYSFEKNIYNPCLTVSQIKLLPNKNTCRKLRK